MLCVCQECFESLLSLLSWSWGMFCSLSADTSGQRGAASTVGMRAAMLDVEQLVYISTASLRLIRTYILTTYPANGMSHT